MLKKLKINWPPLMGGIPTGVAPPSAPQGAMGGPPTHQVALPPRPPTTSPPGAMSGQDTVVSFVAGPLGIIIQQEDNNVITVSSFAVGDQGQALRSGKVAIGDVIVAVNGDPIAKIGIEGFKRAVTNGIRPLLITFRRRQQVAHQRPPTSAGKSVKDKQPPRKRAKQSPVAAAAPPTNATNKPSLPPPPSDVSHTSQPPPVSQIQQQQAVPAQHFNYSGTSDNAMANHNATVGYFSRELLEATSQPAHDQFNPSSMLNMAHPQQLNPATNFQFPTLGTDPSMWASAHAAANAALYASNPMFYSMHNTMQPAMDGSGANPMMMNLGQLHTASVDQHQHDNPINLLMQSFQIPDAVQQPSSQQQQQQPADLQAYFDPQFYTPPSAYRSGSPSAEFVSQVDTPTPPLHSAGDEGATDASVEPMTAASGPAPASINDAGSASSPSASTAVSSTIPKPVDSAPPSTRPFEPQTTQKKPAKKATAETLSSGRRSSRVSRKPEPLVSHTSAPVVAAPTLHIPGAGVQGEYACDALKDAAPPSKSTSHAFALVQAQLLAVEAALPRESFRHNKWTAALRAGWADSIVQAATSRALMEALLVLEMHIENEYLEATWKAQSSLTIKTLVPTATIASVATRLYALDDALSYIKPIKQRQNAGYKRKLTSQPSNTSVATRRSAAEVSETPLPPCPGLPDPELNRLAVQKLRLALTATPHEICQRTLGEICGLTRLPSLLLERWYKQCLDLMPPSAAKPAANQALDTSTSSLASSFNNASVAPPPPKRPKGVRGRRPKHLEYRYEPQHTGISPALAKDPTLRDRFLAVLHALQKTAVAEPFLMPVDVDEFPEYPRVVSQPMDLHTMVQRIQSGVYDNRLQHIPIDMSRIWTNCFAFNSVHAEISTMARRLRSIFHRLMEEWVQLAPVGTLPNQLLSDDACRVCRADANSDAMLLCDSCDAAYHSFCAGLDDIPVGQWYCNRCVENRELK